MGKNTVEFRDDSAAIQYIRERGYASYSSLVNMRDCNVPSFFTSPALNFGKELHSRVLESTKLTKLSKDEEKQLKLMVAAINDNAAARALLKNSKNEVKFHQPLMGVSVLGYMDIVNKTNVADLKTTRHSDMKSFVKSMDFLQAALYLAVSGKKDFFYIGIGKQPPFNVMVFNVNEYPKEFKSKQKELVTLLKYLKKKL